MAAALAEAYDRVLYPSGVFSQTTPDRLATIARLHGLTPPPIETARFLDLGGGDGLNALAFAAAHPKAYAVSVDFARESVARGAALAAAAGLDNARIAYGDVVALADTIDGQYDYIAAHGLYAWVPEAVRVATMKLIARALAPNGVAFVSYNAMPGGHVRMLMREMLIDCAGPIADPFARATAGRQLLAQYSRAQKDDTPLLAGLRTQAAIIARKPEGALIHDEFGEVFAPQRVSDVIAMAERHGLAYLNDAERFIVEDGFPGGSLEQPTPIPENADLTRLLQLADHERLCFFRESLFVRVGAPIARRLDPRNAAGLWLSFRGQRTGRHTLELDKRPFEIGDDRLCEILERAGHMPGRLSLAEEQLDDERLEALVRVFGTGAIHLHSEPWPAALDSERPRASKLALAQLEQGALSLCRLDHHMVTIDDPAPRAFLALLDGTRDRAALREVWAKSEHATIIDSDRAITLLAKAGVLAA